MIRDRKCPAGLKAVLTDELLARIVSATPLHRLATVADVANAARWLASPAASYVTGKVIDIDGGAEAPTAGIPVLQGGEKSTRLPGTLLTEIGKEHGPPLLERGDLTPELFQLAVDARQLGPRLPFPEVSLTVPGADEILNLTAEQPQPRVPVHRAGPVLELARADRRDDLLLR
jgi:hypothetical protein